MKNQFFTEITSGAEARLKILNGINAVANVVGSTQGYRGRTVLIEKNGLPHPTKDGFDVAETIFMEDKVESLACESAKEASKKTADEAGDSTTATLVLLQALLQNSYIELENGKSAIDIKTEIEKSRDLVVNYLKEISVELTPEMIYFVAKTSANGDEEIAKLVANAYEQAGENGSVGHTRSNTDATFIDHNEGTLVERGWSQEAFTNVKSTQSVVFENDPHVLISNISFATIKQILPFLNYCANNGKELLIISEMDYAVEEAIIRNVIDPKFQFKFAVVKCPSIGRKREELLTDLALVCGCNMISSLSGFDFTDRIDEFLGVAKSITVTKDNTIVVRHETTNEEPINGKIAELKEQVKLTEKNYVLKKNIEERIAKLSGGVAMIKVGGITPSEVEEKIARVDDAVRAVRSAKEEGVLAGGGVALFYAKKELELDSVTQASIDSTLLKILSNANIYIFELPNYPIGYDVKEFEEVNMFDAGIIDSTKAIRNAYVNAVSTSNTLLMTDNVVTVSRSV
jgi:chaperonin GroEL